MLDLSAFWKPFCAVFLSFVLAQVLKLINDYLEHREFRWLESGGMPSSHSAIVVSVTVIAILETGFGPLAVIAGAFATIVLYDALNSRWETTRHSEFLNQLTGTKKFRVVGHRPLEVLAGATLGFLVPLIIYSFF